MHANSFRFLYKSASGNKYRSQISINMKLNRLRQQSFLNECPIIYDKGLLVNLNVLFICSDSIRFSVV